MREELFLWANLDFLTLERISFLRKHFGNLKNAYQKATEDELIRLGINPKTVDTFLRRKEQFDIDAAYKVFEKLGAKLMFIEDDDYPSLLREIASPPIFLFYKGELKKEESCPLAVVGSRLYSAYGKEALGRIIPDLVRKDITIISGLARGIDAIAHRECVDQNGRTIGVLGSGIDNVWPNENRRLAERILENDGAIVSEFPLGTLPFAYNFPRRNRIVSGMSKGVFVIEARKKSGSLITAQMAIEQNRDVFALCGNAFAANSEGVNTLIKKGEAKLVMQAQDIFEEFGIDDKVEPRSLILSSQEEKKVFDALSEESMYLDQIIEKIDISAALVSSTLIMLEMKGYVRNLGMGRWARVV